MKRKIFLLSCLFHHFFITESVFHFGTDVNEYNDGIEERSAREKSSKATAIIIIDTNIGAHDRWRSFAKKRAGTYGEKSYTDSNNERNLKYNGEDQTDKERENKNIYNYKYNGREVLDLRYRRRGTEPSQMPDTKFSGRRHLRVNENISNRNPILIYEYDENKNRNEGTPIIVVETNKNRTDMKLLNLTENGDIVNSFKIGSWFDKGHNNIDKGFYQQPIGSLGIVAEHVIENRFRFPWWIFKRPPKPKPKPQPKPTPKPKPKTTKRPKPQSTARIEFENENSNEEASPEKEIESESKEDKDGTKLNKEKLSHLHRFHPDFHNKVIVVETNDENGQHRQLLKINTKGEIVDVTENFESENKKKKLFFWDTIKNIFGFGETSTTTCATTIGSPPKVVENNDDSSKCPDCDINIELNNPNNVVIIFEARNKCKKIQMQGQDIRCTEKDTSIVVVDKATAPQDRGKVFRYKLNNKGEIDENDIKKDISKGKPYSKWRTWLKQWWDKRTSEPGTSNESPNKAINKHKKLSEGQGNKDLELTQEQYEREKAAGSMADLFGSNPHYSYPTLYEDFGRRFFKRSYNTVKKSEVVYSSEEASRTEDSPLIPERAPPEVVLAIAKQAAQLEGSKVVNPTDDLIQREILRTGDYWNAVWKEDVDPTILRTHKKTHKKKIHERDQLENLESIRAKIMPGTKLYELISRLKRKSPRFLYVINIKEKRK